MKIVSSITWLLVLSTLFLSFYSCTSSVMETRIAHENPLFNMIIASDSSEFKDSIRSQVIQQYQNQGNIEIVNIKRLKDIDPNDYDVVLIIDTCLAWSGFNPALNTFLEDNPSKHNVVLFMTAGDPDWAYSYQGVDAITSASVMENVEVKFQEITEQINAIIAHKKNA